MIEITRDSVTIADETIEGPIIFTDDDGAIALKVTGVTIAGPVTMRRPEVAEGG